MTLRSLRDIQQAIAAGRYHQQRFFKGNNASTGDGRWWDWSFAAGQPSYNARIGNALEFTPAIADGNDAIFFPSIEAGMERQLAGITLWGKASNSGQVGVSYEVCDLLGYYPLIDGDSTDTQEMDNTLSLPRYADGQGVMAVLVNHVAPMTAAANGTMVYIGCDGQEKTVSIRAALSSQNTVCSAYPTAGGLGPIGLPQAANCLGVRAIKSITWTTPPGGLHCIYLVRMLTGVQSFTDPYYAASTSGPKVAVQKCNCTANGFHMPRIYDGAWLSIFFMANAGGRNLQLFGHADFIWG